MNLRIELGEVRALATDLGKVSKDVEKRAEQVLERGALNVKNRMVEDARSSHKGAARHFAGSISYDRATRVGQLGYEIGPDKDRQQGALGNILYFGTSKNAPTLDIEAGLIEEAPRLEKALGDLGADVL